MGKLDVTDCGKAGRVATLENPPGLPLSHSPDGDNSPVVRADAKLMHRDCLDITHHPNVLFIRGQNLSGNSENRPKHPTFSLSRIFVSRALTFYLSSNPSCD